MIFIICGFSASLISIDRTHSSLFTVALLHSKTFHCAPIHNNQARFFSFFQNRRIFTLEKSEMLFGNFDSDVEFFCFGFSYWINYFLVLLWLLWMYCLCWTFNSIFVLKKHQEIVSYFCWNSSRFFGFLRCCFFPLWFLVLCFWLLTDLEFTD